MKELNYFIDKPITIITQSINRNFNETQSIDYFTGICEKITQNGIFTIHPITGCKNFIMFSSIVGIFEEQKVYEEDIKQEEIDAKQDTKQEELSFRKNDNKINIDAISKLV
jgi:hypothetical protein